MAPPPLTPPPASDRPPTLVLGGDSDVFLPRSALQETADAWSVELELLKGAPHALMINSAWRDIAAEKIIGWLDEVSARRHAERAVQ